MITIDQYNDHRGNYDGFCTDCKDFTRYGGTEPDVTPDSEGYSCEECEGSNIYGAEMGMIAEVFNIDFGEEEVEAV